MSDPLIPMGDVLAAHAASYPDRTAISCGDDALSYPQLAAATDLAAAHLADAGVGPGDVVAIALPNSIDFLVAAFAAWRLDAVPFPLAAHLPARERDALLALAKPAVVIGEPHPDWTTLSPAALRAELPAERLDQLPRPTGEQPWKVIGSGGSTGLPKLIMAGVPALVDPRVPRYTIGTDDTVLVPGPLYHQGPFIFATAGLLTGGSVVITPRFDAGETLGLIERHQVTWAFLVPTMTHRIWRLPEPQRRAADLSSLRLLFSTGAPWQSWLKQHWLEWLGPDRVIEWYGGTEEQGGLRITGTDAVDHPGAIGQADDDVRVVDADGLPLPPGEIGELVFRSRASGHHTYIGSTAATGEWRGYGDLASIDADGWVRLADRRTDMIVSGGVNVYPAEVESALESHPEVQSAVVIGLPDEDLGQYVHAVVQLDASTDSASAEEELRTHLRDHLAGPKIPRRFEFVEHPLRDDAGKVRRSAVRDQRLAALEATR
ncbi:AMP-binding protein [Nocardioides sp. Bht2]|uniref:AMP-binding protein n=1 Tax=Nocardioides sp. Bht2 TaxID=3392297 RepID=UPI0039B48E73